MNDLIIENYIRLLQQYIEGRYNIIFYLFTYNLIQSHWEFTLINSRYNTLYLPFVYKGKRIYYYFYYQSVYRKLK